MTPPELEEEADRLRADLAATVGQLGRNLAPSNILDEIKENSGLSDVTPAKVFAAGKRHPVATMLVGLGVGVWAYRAVRRARGGERGRGLGAAMRAVAEPAAAVVRDRAEAKREEFTNAARSQAAAGAAWLSEAIESGLDELVSDASAANPAHPIIRTAIQAIVFAALDLALSRTVK